MQIIIDENKELSAVLHDSLLIFVILILIYIPHMHKPSPVFQMYTCIYWIWYLLVNSKF